MSSTFFLSPPPPPPLLPHLINTSNSHYTSVSITDLHIPKSISLRIPKPIDRSEWLKLYSTSSSVSIATVGNGDGNENRDTENEPEPTKPVHSFSPEPSKGYSSAIKMRTAPWMKGPFSLEPNQVVDLSKSRKTKDYADGKHRHRPDSSLTEKVSGGRGNKAMKKIFISIDKLQEKQKPEETQKAPGKIELDFSMAESPEVEEESKSGGKMPWERKERIVIPRLKKEKVVNVAELGLDRELLERLRSEASRMRKWVKVKKAGVTQAVVDQIHLIWKDSELAMINFDFPLCQSMARAREIVEMKTGGLVVWRKKDFLVVYRGCNYRRPFKTSWKKHDSLDRKISTKEDSEEESSAINASLYEREADRLLDGLGPRFVDWWRPKPLPVDADLLPEVVPGFKPPFRLCPPRARPKLTDYELTYLRNLSHPLPTHFVLGRNRKLQGLAAAILKLWEKCHIAKIAVKLGVPNTSNEQMANELKSLTGGVLLLRNKFLILLYRGKDFLPHSVANSVADRETELMKYQLEEEAARRKAAEKTFYLMDESLSNTSSTIGTLSEFEDILSERGDLNKGNSEAEVPLEAEKARLEKQLRNHERQLFILNKKIERSAKQLEKLNSAWRPAEHDEDQEMITDEEKECLRKIGLKMDSSLVLGRRGVFGGVIEGLHQHWKHREVVKVITMQRRFSQVVFTAKRLEVESGGILVSVDKQKEGHAIIIYRGKNYRRPLNLPARNLLTKREALFRSLEMQRVGSLKFFAYQRQKQISELKNKLAELESTRIEQ